METIAPDITLLVLAAASIGFTHTLLGPDHYLPFVALARARNWSTSRTAGVTLACGLGHVLGSIVIGAAGIAAGTALNELVALEAFRGSVAAWLLLGFGLAYLAWGLKRGLRGSRHSHVHVHADGTRHSHPHDHRLAPHVHPHGAQPGMPAGERLNFTPVRPSRTASVLVTPWALFVIFVFGPCEALIPVLMYPAAWSDWGAVAAVCAAFGLATLGTMVGIVLLARWGLDAIGAGIEGMQRWSHAFAGATITACGGAIIFLGL